MKEYRKEYDIKNKEKLASYHKEYQKKNKEKIVVARRRVAYKRKYGLTIEKYNELLEGQQGVCAICGNMETRTDPRVDRPTNLAIDHCHTTGKVRGLLCSSCNVAIGHFNDDLSLLEMAISYLKR